MIEPNGRDKSAQKVNPPPSGIPAEADKDALLLPAHPTATKTQSPAEQAESLIRNYCQGKMQLLDEDGLAKRRAEHLPSISRMLLGPSKDPRKLEPWQSIPKNPRYDNYVVELIAAAEEPNGDHHFFVAVTNTQNEYIVPRQEVSGKKIKWNLEDPLASSRTHFCGLHLILKGFVRQDGSFGRTITPVPILPPQLINQEIHRTAEGDPDSVLRRALDDAAKRHLSGLPLGEDSQARVTMQVGSQSSDGRMEMLGTNLLGERIAIVATQTSPIHFDFLAEVPFTPSSHDAFLLGRTQGSRRSGSLPELCAYLYGSNGAQLAPQEGTQSYELLTEAVNRKLLQRYQSLRSINNLTFTIAGGIINQEDRTGLLCVTLKDSSGAFVVPGDGGTFATCNEPTMLVVYPTIRQRVPRNRTATSLYQPAVPWLVENSDRVGRVERALGDLEITLSGITCSEQFFCSQMDDLARRPADNIFESGLIDRVRGQLRHARLPVNKLECKVLDLAGEENGTKMPHRGYVLMEHSFGKSLLLLRRDKRSGYVALQRPERCDALFLDA